MYWVSPNKGEQYYLRILLAKYPTTSYENLLKLGGDDSTTFQQVARHLGLVNDDYEYRETLREASCFMYGYRLRSLFALLCNIGAPAALLWSVLKRTICFYLLHKYPNNENKAFKECLKQIDRALRRHGSNLVQLGLPPVYDDTTELIRELIDYNINDLQSFVQQWLPLLSKDQQIIFNYIEVSLSNDSTITPTTVNKNSKIIFIDAPGGYGKTKLLEVIAAHVRSKNEDVLCVASSGIAALNLPGGITAHSMFKLPLSITTDSTDYWGITAHCQRAKLIKNARLIIYDEAPMTNRYLIEMIDRSLKDLMNCNLPLGGKIVIFSGDFRQVAPIVRNALTNADVVAVSLKLSYIWHILKVFKLDTPHRVTDNPEFSSFLLKVGDAKIPNVFIDTEYSRLVIPLLPQVKLVTKLDDLLYFVFPTNLIQDPDTCATRAILSTLNYNVREINAKIMERIHGDIVTLHSADYLDDDTNLLSHGQTIRYLANVKI